MKYYNNEKVTLDIRKAVLGVRLVNLSNGSPGAVEHSSLEVLKY